MTEFLLQLLNGLTLGGIYALIALGYTMVYGILKLINFAHGEIFMIGAFGGLVAATSLSGNFFVVMVVAMIVAAILGLLVERAAYRPLRDGTSNNKIFTAIVVFSVIVFTFLMKNSVGELFSKPLFWVGVVILAIVIIWEKNPRKKSRKKVESSRINALISAIGVSIVISNVVAAVHGPQRANYPQIINMGDIEIFGTSVSLLQFFIIFSSLVLMGILSFIVNKTKAGLAMKAVSQNMNAARLMGISPNVVIAYTFALGSALAAAAGVLVGVYYTVAEATMGSMYGLKAFVAAVLGGIGSIPGAMVGGFILGVAEIFGVALTPYIVKAAAFVGIEFGTPSFRDAIVFGILIFILIIKPAGLFGSNAKEKV